MSVLVLLALLAANGEPLPPLPSGLTLKTLSAPALERAIRRQPLFPDANGGHLSVPWISRLGPDAALAAVALAEDAPRDPGVFHCQGRPFVSARVQLLLLTRAEGRWGIVDRVEVPVPPFTDTGCQIAIVSKGVGHARGELSLRVEVTSVKRAAGSGQSQHALVVRVTDQRLRVVLSTPGDRIEPGECHKREVLVMFPAEGRLRVETWIWEGPGHQTLCRQSGRDAVRYVWSAAEERWVQQGQTLHHLYVVVAARSDTSEAIDARLADAQDMARLTAQLQLAPSYPKRMAASDFGRKTPQHYLVVGICDNEEDAGLALERLPDNPGQFMAPGESERIELAAACPRPRP